MKTYGVYDVPSPSKGDVLVVKIQGIVYLAVFPTHDDAELFITLTHRRFPKRNMYIQEILL